MDKQNTISNLKEDILINVIKAFDTENFEESARKIPYVMRPKNTEVALRCCIYKERAIIKDRAIAALGFSNEDDDETVSLSSYAKAATERKKPDEKMLTVLQAACKGCVPNRVHVTDMCQGCVARPCTQSCPFGAIKLVEGRSTIDATKCKNCMRCVNVCPYNAIAKIRVPCEDVCPVDAIKKDATGAASIDFDACISCGKCVGDCPFGAINEKSQIIDVLMKMKTGEQVVALVAPSIAGQFENAEMGQIKTALEKAGFLDVIEVAYGADITIKHEGECFVDRMDQGDEFMTTSCCSAYNQLVEKHLPEIKKFVASSKTPVNYTAEFAKKERPYSVSVFISPCTSKRKEGQADPHIDYVLNFNEIRDLFVARGIDPSKCKSGDFRQKSSHQARNFPKTGGVAGAVTDYLHPQDIEPTPYFIDGINKNSIRELKKIATEGKCEQGNLIEVMGCKNGCLGGNATIMPASKSQPVMEAYAEQGFEIE